MEEELRDIIRSVVMTEPIKPPKKEGAGTRFARYFAHRGLDFYIPEIRDEARFASFEE